MQNLKQTLSIFSWVSTRQLEKKNHQLIFRDHLKHFSKKKQKKKKEIPSRIQASGQRAQANVNFSHHLFLPGLAFTHNFLPSLSHYHFMSSVRKQGLKNFTSGQESVLLKYSALQKHHKASENASSWCLRGSLFLPCICFLFCFQFCFLSANLPSS